MLQRTKKWTRKKRGRREKTSADVATDISKHQMCLLSTVYFAEAAQNSPRPEVGMRKHIANAPLTRQVSGDQSIEKAQKTHLESALKGNI